MYDYVKFLWNLRQSVECLLSYNWIELWKVLWIVKNRMTGMHFSIISTHIIIYRISQILKYFPQARGSDGVGHRASDSHFNARSSNPGLVIGIFLLYFMILRYFSTIRTLIWWKHFPLLSVKNNWLAQFQAFIMRCLCVSANENVWK